jgi:hypothetical protein
MNPSSIMSRSVAWASESGQKKFLSLRHPQSFLTRPIRPEGPESVELLVDSTEFQVKGKCSVYKDKLKWSHKLHSPGRCWVTVTNGRGQTQWVSPPFLPIVYDGDILISSGSVLDVLFPNLEMIGDNHFRKAAPLLKKVTLHTNITKAGRPRMADGKKIPVTLTPEEEEWNR